MTGNPKHFRSSRYSMSRFLICSIVRLLMIDEVLYDAHKGLLISVLFGLIVSVFTITYISILAGVIAGTLTYLRKIKLHHINIKK